MGDRVDYDQAAQTMTLTGPVVVTQGANVLKGRRLVYNRATQKMQLSAPANVMGSASAGPDHSPFRQALVEIRVEPVIR